MTQTAKDKPAPPKKRPKNGVAGDALPKPPEVTMITVAPQEAPPAPPVITTGPAPMVTATADPKQWPRDAFRWPRGERAGLGDVSRAELVAAARSLGHAAPDAFLDTLPHERLGDIVSTAIALRQIAEIAGHLSPEQLEARINAQRKPIVEANGEGLERLARSERAERPTPRLVWSMPPSSGAPALRVVVTADGFVVEAFTRTALGGGTWSRVEPDTSAQSWFSIAISGALATLPGRGA